MLHPWAQDIKDTEASLSADGSMSSEVKDRCEVEPSNVQWGGSRKIDKWI